MKQKKNNNDVNAAIILSAGKGKRYSNKKIKQYEIISGKSILEWTLEPFISCNLIKHICLVIDKKHIKLIGSKILNNHDILLAYGGKRRQDSVQSGLELLKKFNPKYVLIHDAVRPNINKELLNNVIKNLKKKKAIVPILNIVDSVKKVSQGKISESINRDLLFLAQTPQGFHYKEIYELYKCNTKINYNDEAELYHANGKNISTINGLRGNTKITYKDD